jgi:hypothetical protein
LISISAASPQYEFFLDICRFPPFSFLYDFPEFFQLDSIYGVGVLPFYGELSRFDFLYKLSDGIGGFLSNLLI